LAAELEKNGEQIISRAKCPICRVSILPTNNSPLLLQIRSAVAGTKWATQLPPEKGTKERDPLLAVAPQTQPNGSEMVAIEIGQRVEFGERGRKQQQPDDPKLHAPPRPRRITLNDEREGEISFKDQIKSISRVMLNCLMLRNVRIFSLGASPRQTLLMIGIICLVLFFGFHFVLPSLVS
jgi:hypothetical protein